MNALRRQLVSAALAATLGFSVATAEERPAGSGAPMPRPRLTEPLRIKAEELARDAKASGTVTMDTFVVRESRPPNSLQNGPPGEQPTVGKFSITHGGYRLKTDGAKFSTEVGLWRHRSEEHTSELQSRFGISYAVFC